MTRYAVTANPARSASARGSYLRVSYKNSRETAQAVSGWNLQKAKKYLDQVLEHERVIPFRRFNGSIGRTAQGKEFGVTKGRWPTKSVQFIQGLLKNAEANADVCILSLLSILSNHINIILFSSVFFYFQKDIKKIM
ncbi:unnamed protein product [[Candida] boidinii]|nr:unnamed protein product [[Candida] boidinii]